MDALEVAFIGLTCSDWLLSFLFSNVKGGYFKSQFS